MQAQLYDHYNIVTVDSNNYVAYKRKQAVV